jgi:hypothetical protein
MGKKEKEHRKKVAARNEKIKQKKSAMQKAFDLLLKTQMDKMIEENNLNVEMSGNNLNFEVVEEKTFDHALSFQPNPEKSKLIENLFVDNAEHTVEDEKESPEK